MKINDGAESCPECKHALEELTQANRVEPACNTEECAPSTWPSLLRLVAWLRSHATLP